MPSEDSKPVKQESEDDERSLSSMVLARRKNPTNAGTVTPKPRPKPAKVKKESSEDEDDSDEDFDGVVKPKKGSSQVRSKSAAKLKKEEDDDEKPIARRSSASKPAKDSSVKKQKKTEVVKGKGSAGTQQNGTKKEKKVYSLPGQKRDPPEERDPLRIFYETLYKQIPNSEMAQVWMMESGLLPKDKAQKVLDMKLKKKNQKFASPMKKGTPTTTTTTKKSNGATDTKKKPSPSPVSTSAKGKTAPSKVTAKDSNKKRKASSDSDNDSDDDFVVNVMSKRQRAS
ncbi:unnamed protein product [Linum trigynum]|uniref:Uncharacterized protein n=1 Tax=Linum trigynum TaxID=586398 RepID=A0AAV2ED87_9ROSI